ncbi:hypothetical protein LguiB_008362 [Lonicera macranthoides]
MIIIMAPHGEAMVNSYSKPMNTKAPRRLSTEIIQRTKSDISFEMSKEKIEIEEVLPPIPEVEDAKCECCGMTEECTHDYIDRVRAKFFGKWICGLCTEAVKEEVEKNGGKKDEALSAHMSACVRFNKYGRAYPVLYQAEAMREMLKKTRMEGRGIRAKSTSPKVVMKKGGMVRSSSCIPAITKDVNDLALQN